VFIFAVFRPRRTHRRRGRSTSGRYRARLADPADQRDQLGRFRRSLLEDRGVPEVRWALLDPAVRRVLERRCRQEGLLDRALRRVPFRRVCSECSELVGRRRPDRHLGQVVLEVRSGQVVLLGRAVRCFLAGLVDQAGRCFQPVQMGRVGQEDLVGKGCTVESRPPRRRSGVGLACLGRLGHRGRRVCRLDQDFRGVRGDPVGSILRSRRRPDA